MSTGVWVLVAAVVAVAGFALWRARRDGRVRTRARAVEPGSVLDGTPWADDLGERATLVQFSSAFCAPCRTTRVVLADVAAREPGVRHLEVDAEQHLDVVRRLGVLRTPTTLVLDRDGRELGRAAGAPSRDQVLASLPERLA